MNAEFTDRQAGKEALSGKIYVGFIQGYRTGEQMQAKTRMMGFLGAVGVVIVSGLALKSRQAPAPAPQPKITSDSSAADTVISSSLKAERVDSFFTLTGVVQPSAQAAISVIQPSRVVQTFIHNGQRVNRGQVLIVLDSTEAHSQELSAQEAVTAAASQLAKAKAGAQVKDIDAASSVLNAKAALNQAIQKLSQSQLKAKAAAVESNVDSVSALQNELKAKIGLQQALHTLHSLLALQSVGGVSRSQLQGAQAQVRSAQSDLKSAEAMARAAAAGPLPGVTFKAALAQRDIQQAELGVKQARDGVKSALKGLTQVKRIGQSDIASAEAALKQSNAGLAPAIALEKSTTLSSPIEGIVTGMSIHPGETAQPGAPLFTVIAYQSPHVEALALTRQTLLMHPGETVSIFPDSMSKRPIQAVIAVISNIAEPDGRSFRIRFKLIHPPANLPIGQSAQIQIPLR